MSILNIINQVAATSSRKEKEAILEANKDNETLKAVFKAAYDPTISYFIKKIPLYETMFSNPTPLNLAIENITNDIVSRKFTGNQAITYISEQLADMLPEDAEVLTRIIDRDLKCGATDSTANKIWKGLIPEFPYMRCSLPKDVKLEKWDWSKGIISQLKADAMYANCDVYSGGDVIFTSRNGTQIPNEHLSELIVTVLETLPRDIRVSGEMQVERDGKILPREIGNGIMNSIAKGGTFGPGERPVFVVWDIIPLEYAVPGGKYQTSYDERFGQLQSYLATGAANGNTSLQLIETRIVYSLDEAYEHYFELVALGFEGTIIKTRSGIWADNTSKDQVKLKVEADVDLIIVGKTAGNGKHAATFGALTCQTSDGLLEVNVSGYTDAKRKELHEMGDALMSKIMAVRFNSIMKPTANNQKYSLFLPRSVEVRDDKTEADTLQRVIDQFETAIGKKK